MLILASRSQIRQQLLKAAGYDFIVKDHLVCEDVIKDQASLTGCGVDDIALTLARAKAISVSRNNGDDLVIGADQTLDLDGKNLNKADDLVAARQQLQLLNGKEHKLYSAIFVARNGKKVWQCKRTATMTMRLLSEDEIDRYLARAGAAIAASVGCYQIEGLGINLFARIAGGYDTILGLPMLGLTKCLRQQQIFAY